MTLFSEIGTARKLWIEAEHRFLIETYLGLHCFVVLSIPLGIYLWKRWPYRGREVVPALAQTFSSTVQVGSYKRFYFPRPGFVAHDVTVRLHGSTNIPPLATVETLTAADSYFDFIFEPRHLHALTIEGLHVQIPAAGTAENGTEFLSGPSSPSKTVVDKITADQSLLEVDTDHGNLFRSPSGRR
jgi:hypothetical protein